MMRSMVIDMNDERLDTRAQLQAFLDRTRVVGFAVARDARYEFIARTVCHFGHARLAAHVSARKILLDRQRR